MIATMSIGCGNGGQTSGSDPDRPRPQTYCYVGQGPNGYDQAVFRVTTPIETPEGDGMRVENVDWEVFCHADSCTGRALNLSRVDQGASATLSLNDARIAWVRGLEAEVRWQASVFTIDADAGIVIYRGSLSHGGTVGVGKARCEKHGRPQHVTTPGTGGSSKP